MHVAQRNNGYEERYNANRKGNPKAELTSKRRICRKRNVLSLEAPRRLPGRGNTRRSIAKDRTAACELPPSRRVSGYMETSAVCLFAERNKYAHPADLTF